MRKTFSDIIEKIALSDPKIIFMTGDLGFNAFENLQQSLGSRFINAGVAEQNMISVAAGMAYKGYKVFCYSIAPFIVFRALEQFRNDVCFHKLPVFLVGNGGGYGYGIMGSSHHALEDLACLSGLPNSTCWIPAFNDDLEKILSTIVERQQPAYLRLGLGKAAPVSNAELSTSFKKVMVAKESKGTVIALGPIVNNVLKALENADIKDRFNVLTLISLPLVVTDEIKKMIEKGRHLVVVEEHVSTGGAAQQLSTIMLEQNMRLDHFLSLHAEGYPNGLYGNQDYHQQQSGLDAENITKTLKKLI